MCPQNSNASGGVGNASGNNNNNDTAVAANSVIANSSVANNINENSTIVNNDNKNNTTDNLARKPRRSIKAEGTHLHNLLESGQAKVIDASKLGKRLSSEIWNSFGAIQVDNDFNNEAIDTKTVEDGVSKVKICQFFVACSRCFSVFKYDGHAYGTTGLVKHVKTCHGMGGSMLGTPITTFSNGPMRRKNTMRARNVPPSLRQLARVIEELRGEQAELKQKINEMMNMMGGGYVDQIQIISNDSDKVGEAQKND